MKVLIIGGGGREHALAWAAAHSPHVSEVICAPGNAGTLALGRNMALPARPPFDEIVEFVRREKIGLVIVGPEQPLVEGLADALRVIGAPVFGPSRAAAQIEGSKQFAKDVMHRAGVPTADSRIVASREEGLAALAAWGRFPVVLKADGLAAGKGVSIHEDAASAAARLDAIFVRREFGEAGARVLIEEFLTGPEVSILAICDGRHFVTLAPAQDHKAIGEGDTGPNTGGMGSYCPAPIVTHALRRDFEQRIIAPVLAQMREDGAPFTGCLFAGLMLTPDRGPMALEFNCRFGDPETQSILPLIKSDLVDLMLASCEGRIASARMEWKSAADAGGTGDAPAHALCVVMAAEGYPGACEKGCEIRSLDAAAARSNVIVFHAGTAQDADGRVVTAGGRVLGVTGLGASLQEARDRAYAAADQIHFDGAYRRRDIGHRAGVAWR